MSAQMPNPSWTDMEKIRGDFHTLYLREEPHPPGQPLETHVNPAKVDNNIPSEAEVETAVLRLCPHMASGHNHICAEHFNQWQR